METTVEPTVETRLRPSALPFLKECSQFVSGPPKDFTNAGTLRHTGLEHILTTDEHHPDLPEEERDKVEWAAEQVRIHMPMSDYPLECERAYSLFHPEDEFNEIMRGTPDGVCGPMFGFDLKSRRRNYREQMAAYALAIMQAKRGAEFRFLMLFSEERYAEWYEFTAESAWALIEPVLVERESKPPTPFDHCSWCAKHESCPALVDRVNHVIDGRPEWEIEHFKGKELATCDADELGRIYELAKQVGDWAKARTEDIRKLIKDGHEVAGYEGKEISGGKFVRDINEAFALSGLTPDEMLSACKVSLPSLTKVYAGKHQMKEAPAKRELMAKLDPILEDNNPKFQVKVKKQDKLLTKN